MQIDCDKAIMVTLKHDDKLQDGSECAFQVQTTFLCNLCQVLNPHVAYYLVKLVSIE